MTSYWIGVIGAWVVADGFASLWAYAQKPKETFWRNHTLRILRILLGIVLIGLGYLLGD